MRVIILIGGSGVGKSALVNLMCPKSSYTESRGSSSCSQETERGDFILKGIPYRVINPLGYGHTQKTQVDVISSILSAFEEAGNNLYHVFYMYRGVFTFSGASFY